MYFRAEFFGAQYWAADFFVTRGAVGPPVVVVPPAVRRGAPRAAERLYLPPGKYTRKRKQQAVDALKTLYAEAREVIPDDLQVGLIPPEIALRARASVTLPPASSVDFEALAGSIETIRVLIAAIEAQRDLEAKRKKRRAEEERLLMILMDVL